MLQNCSVASFKGATVFIVVAMDMVRCRTVTLLTEDTASKAGGAVKVHGRPWWTNIRAVHNAVHNAQRTTHNPGPAASKYIQTLMSMVNTAYGCIYIYICTA